MSTDLTGFDDNSETQTLVKLQGAELASQPAWEHRASLLAFMRFDPDFKRAVTIVGVSVMAGLFLLEALVKILVSLNLGIVPSLALLSFPFVWAAFSVLSGVFTLYQRRQALRYGAMVRGRITGVSSNGIRNHRYRPPSPATHYSVKVSYVDFDGTLREDAEYLAWRDDFYGRLPLKIGDPVMLKVDRRNPEVAVIPMLHGQRVAEVQDTRRMLPAPSTAEAHLDDVSCELYDDDPARRRPQKVGDLALRDSLLSMTLGHGDQVDVDLSKPFVLQLSAWLEGGSRAAVHLTLRPRGAGADAGAVVEFSVPLTQSEVDSRVALRQTYLPVVARRDFEKLWPVLVGHLKSHGDPVWQQLSL